MARMGWENANLRKSVRGGVEFERKQVWCAQGAHKEIVGFSGCPLREKKNT